MPNDLKLTKHRGPEAREHIDKVGHLRITVFREFPYLYDGSMEYETKYLQTYFSCDHSFVCLCWDDDTIVGATTAIPLEFEEEDFKRPFLDRSYNPKEIVYFGESILLSSYRGRGIGQQFFDVREDYAQGYGGIKYTSFCAVVRDNDDHRKPNGYKDLRNFWLRNGYEVEAGLMTKYSWKEIGQSSECENDMQFWLKKIL